MKKRFLAFLNLAGYNCLIKIHIGVEKKGAKPTVLKWITLNYIYFDDASSKFRTRLC